MSDLRDQIRDHYDAQSLSTEKVEGILTRGRAAAAGGEAAKEETKIMAFPASAPRKWRRALPLVAALAILVGLAAWWIQTEVNAVPYAALPARLIEFLASQPQLAHAPQQKAELRSWLLARGAPEFQIPRTLLPLESFACTVLDVRGRPTWLACFWRERGPERGPTELVHLLVSRRGDFRGAPADSLPVELRERDGWSFASWAEGDVLYTLATPAPAEKLRPFLTASADFRRLLMASLD